MTDVEDLIVICSPISENPEKPPMGDKELTLYALCHKYANGLWPVSGLSGQLSS